MAGFLLRVLITALGLWIAEAVVSGITFATPASLFWAALLLGLVNAFVRPVLVLLTLPITVLSLGLFLWVINALMILLVSSLLGGFEVEGFGSALLGALVVSLTSWIASWYVGPRGRVEVLVVDR